MIEINPKQWKYAPLSYQLQGVKDVIQHPEFALFWEMRLRKSKVILDAAGVLYSAGLLEVLLIVCPAQVKDVWLEREFGEIAKHSWVPTSVLEYDADCTEDRVRQNASRDKLCVIVASLEFIRQEDEDDNFPKVDALRRALKDRAVWLVVDEASAIGNHKSLQSRACEQLRAVGRRVTELDGTPTGDGSPESLYMKFKLLNPTILGFKNYYRFMYRHALYRVQKFGGRQFKKVVGWKNLEELTSKTAPFCHRLEQKDVKGILDLPEFIPGELTCRLSDQNWETYCRMRDEMVAEIDKDRTWVQHSSVKVLRLAQICAGFLGGFQGDQERVTKEIGDESTQSFLAWFRARLEEDQNFKCVVWCRWRPEIARLRHLALGLGIRIGEQWGDTKDENFLHPDHPYQGAAIMICQAQAVQYGVSFAKAPAQVYLSQDYNLRTRQQSQERVQDEVKKIGRTTTLMLDMVVCGPKGQRTVTHDIVRSLRSKEDVGKRIASKWKRVLCEEW